LQFNYFFPDFQNTHTHQQLIVYNFSCPPASDQLKPQIYVHLSNQQFAAKTNRMKINEYCHNFWLKSHNFANKLLNSKFILIQNIQKHASQYEYSWYMCRFAKKRNKTETCERCGKFLDKVSLIYSWEFKTHRHVAHLCMTSKSQKKDNTTNII